ncbi:uncharacterized protein LOC110977512 [Acanthaster planci]|uniref:Uncharacterized protein LOC110977512 n=1 Tax=Acanthaster planci TaxID=133434 RepID=A0A8B7Y2M6_ACAPL|nr:uncharacterized protein LOC110977512 [Acanthaster planci]
MNGNRIDEASTVFVSCPKEELECDIQESVEGCKFELMCRYIPSCFTVLRCKLANRLLDFPGLTKKGDWCTTKYCENGPLGADNVLCYLYSNTLPAHLQTRVVIPLPSTLTTSAASTAEPVTPPAEPSPQPPDSPDNFLNLPQKMVSNFTMRALVLLWWSLLVSHLAWGKLEIPSVVKLHTGQRTHIECVHTCQRDECEVRLGWVNLPPEFRGFEECFNATHHSLKMSTEAGREEVPSRRRVTCVARATDGATLEETSTWLEICPTEMLKCKLTKEQRVPANLAHASYLSACEFVTMCGTAPLCEANGELLDFLDFNATTEPPVNVFRAIGLAPGDTVTCFLLSDKMEPHLQTRFEMTVPLESETPTRGSQTTIRQQASTTKTTTSTTETKLSTPPTSPTNQCPLTPCDCTAPWVLFALTLIVLICIIVRILRRYVKQTPANQRTWESFHNYVCMCKYALKGVNTTTEAFSEISFSD